MDQEGRADVWNFDSGNGFLIRLELQLHDAIYRLRFYSNSLIHILSLLNSHNNVASIQKNRGDKSQRVIVALEFFKRGNKRFLTE